MFCPGVNLFLSSLSLSLAVALGVVLRATIGPEQLIN